VAVESAEGKIVPFLRQL